MTLPFSGHDFSHDSLSLFLPLVLSSPSLSLVLSCLLPEITQVHLGARHRVLLPGLPCDVKFNVTLMSLGQSYYSIQLEREADKAVVNLIRFARLVG